MTGVARSNVSVFEYLRIKAHLLYHNPERALRQIEVQNSFSLSRTLGTPNITSKGALERRTIAIPVALFSHDQHRRMSPSNTSTKLVEEVQGSGVDESRDLNSRHLSNRLNSERPTWTWRKDDGNILITVQVPRLVCH